MVEVLILLRVLLTFGHNNRDEVASKGRGQKFSIIDFSAPDWQNLGLIH